MLRMGDAELKVGFTVFNARKKLNHRHQRSEICHDQMLQRFIREKVTAPARLAIDVGDG